MYLNHPFRLSFLSNAMSMLTGEDKGEMRLYEDLGDYTLIKPMFEEILALYNSKRKAMTLVFFEDALEHLTRICRTMRYDEEPFILSPP